MNRKWYSNWWYKEIRVVEVLKPISNSLEVAFQKVGDLYVKHQYVWDNAEEVEEVSDNEFADSDDDIDPEDIDW